jgi:hypothetical protein
MMRRFFLFGGVHGNGDSLTWLTRVVRARCPDALLFAGGILPPLRAPDGASSPWGLGPKARRFIEEFFATLGELGVFTALIPAMAGEPLEDFLRLALQAELIHPHVHVAHATLVQERGLAVCGLGGVLAEERLLGMDCCSRPVAEYFLRPLWTAKESRKVLLLPAPPRGKLGGAEGDPLVGELLDSFHPDLCVVGAAASGVAASVPDTRWWSTPAAWPTAARPGWTGRSEVSPRSRSSTCARRGPAGGWSPGRR